MKLTLGFLLIAILGIALAQFLRQNSLYRNAKLRDEVSTEDTSNSNEDNEGVKRFGFGNNRRRQRHRRPWGRNRPWGGPMPPQNYPRENKPKHGLFEVNLSGNIGPIGGSIEFGVG